MDETLLAAYLATDYRVRLTRGGYASIHIKERVPTSLLSVIGTRPWAVITSWNPQSVSQSRTRNRAAQHQLLAALRVLPSLLTVHGALGVGQSGWREPSLFTVGPDMRQLDTLATTFGQYAYVHGHADGKAQLRCLR
jgi:hypothetical protein